MKNWYSLTDLVEGTEDLDPNLMGGPLRYMYWVLARQVFGGREGFLTHMTDFVNDERFCIQENAKRREKKDRVLTSLIKGTSFKDEPVKELQWKRFLEGMALCKVQSCTLEVTARKKLRIRDIERTRSVTFNPTLLSIDNRIASNDKVRGVGERMRRYLENPSEGVSDMNHPLGTLYWALVDEFRAGPQWERLMEEYLSNPDNCVQLRFQRNDKYSNIKKAICNKECISWSRWCQAILALAIDEVDLTLIITTADDSVFSCKHTVDMRTLEFIKEN